MPNIAKGPPRSHDSSRDVPTIEDVYESKQVPPPELRGRARKTWHTRPKSPGIKWYKHYDEQQAKLGRVFVIDYVKADLTREGMRKVAAQEISRPEDLPKLYDNPGRRDDALLRLIHVQNCAWGTQYLLKKYFAPYDDFGRDFGKYVSYKYPERRGGKPLLRGKTWATQHEPRRNLIKTAFGIDYMKIYKLMNPMIEMGKDKAGKIMELNCFDEEDEHPRCGYELLGQRTSCYIQQREDGPESLGHSRSTSPARPGSKHSHDHALDNGNVVLIIENSSNHSISDTLISARGKWENRWRRLPFYLAYESSDEAADDESLALQCTKLILKDIFKANSENWDKFLDLASTHVGILEDLIYDFPADESRADEIWRNSSQWLKAERTMLTHLDTIKESQTNLKELADDPSSSESQWLEANEADYERLATRVQEDLTKPTANLSDLMYKSVGIRDTRHSLELSYSMWRLSWITFIFLPLTFISTAFGMNVSPFVASQDGFDPPALKWYFIAAAPLMVLVLILYELLQRMVARSRPDPYPRGVYERLFQELASDYPLLWSRAGPRGDLLTGTSYGSTGNRMGSGLMSLPTRRAGFISSRADALKWKLVQRWNRPAKTVSRDVREQADQFDGLSSWNQLKRTLTRRWTAEICEGIKTRPPEPESAENGTALANGSAQVVEETLKGEKGKSPGSMDETVHFQGPGNHGDPDMLHPSVALRAKTEPIERLSSQPSSRRNSSAGSSGGHRGSLMVEEHQAGWLHGVS